jgi:hypothetical protein
MIARKYRERRNLLIPAVLSIGFFVNSANAQAASPLSAVTQQSTPQAVVSALWNTIFRVCPVPGSSPLEHSSFYAGSPRQNRVLYEYRETPDTKDTIFPDELKTADRLNGIEWRGLAKWYAGAYRTWEDGGSGWSEWKGMTKEDIDPAQLLASLGGRPLAGNLIFFLEKKRGNGSIEVVSVSLGGMRRESFEPDEYWATRPTCEVATSSNPLATADVRNAAGSPIKGVPGEQNYTKLIEDLVSENAKSWMMNRFVSGSVKNLTVITTDSGGRPSKLTAQYAFDGFGGRSSGTLTLTFSEGVPECMYFFDFPSTCRKPSPAIANAYAAGHYKMIDSGK